VAVAMLVEKKSVEELQKIISQRRVITKDRVLANSKLAMLVLSPSC
jgi:hypothetical protein